MKLPFKTFLFNLKKRKVLWYLYLILLMPLCFEISLRLIGARPYSQNDYYIESIPETPFIGNDSLAIILNPGVFDITLNKQHTFTTTHTKDKLRKVAFLNPVVASHPEVAMLGCSFTYGFGVNDEDHFTSILQKKYQELEFTNYGVIGYGTTHSYLQLQKITQSKNFPEVVILNFATDHFNRNVLTNSYRRGLKIGFNRSLESAQSIMKNSQYPYTLNTQLDINYQKWEDMYEDWDGRNIFSSINWIQTTKDRIEDNSKKSTDITFALIKAINAICKKHNATFFVALLDNNNESSKLKSMLTKNSIEFLDVGFDFKNKQLINYPHDNHPNTIGHQFIAKKIDSKLIKVFKNE